MVAGKPDISDLVLAVRAVRGGQGSFDTSVISVSPARRDVPKDAGTTTFSVSNTGTGTMPWTAAVTSGGSWLQIQSGASGSNSGTITCSYYANTTSSVRTATIRITASDATGSPVDVIVGQMPSPPPTPIQPVVSVSPASRDVAEGAGTTTFSVSNTGTGQCSGQPQSRQAAVGFRSHQRAAAAIPVQFYAVIQPIPHHQSEQVLSV